MGGRPDVGDKRSTYIGLSSKQQLTHVLGVPRGQGEQPHENRN
jgi:hypothetical protein